MGVDAKVVAIKLIPTDMRFRVRDMPGKVDGPRRLLVSLKWADLLGTA